MISNSVNNARYIRINIYSCNRFRKRIINSLGERVVYEVNADRLITCQFFDEEQDSDVRHKVEQRRSSRRLLTTSATSPRPHTTFR